MNIVIMPEKVFLDNKVDKSLKWQTFSSNTTTALFNHDPETFRFKSFLMLSNDELNDAMSNPKKVEDMLQKKLGMVANHFGEFYKLENL